MNKKINTGFLSNLVNDYRSKISEDTGIADIVTFSEANWGLSFNMFPMQKFILKTYYGLPLDNTEKSIPLPDELNQKTLGWFTEVEMMDYLIENKRTNIKEYVPGQTRRELLLVCGRRVPKSGKAAFTKSGNHLLRRWQRLFQWERPWEKERLLRCLLHFRNRDCSGTNIGSRLITPKIF